MAFDFKKSLIKVQGGRTYLPVSARIVWFREEHPDWAVVTEPLEINHEKQYAVFRATIFNGEGKIMATGTKKEDVKGFGDYLEKAETGAVGRALALCGFGTQFSPEMDETASGRLADSPYPVGGSRYSGGGGGYSSGNRLGNDGGGFNADNSRSNSGGGRFTPPRDVPAPREQASPPPRDEPAPRPVVENSIPRPSPAPVTPDDVDEFEALIGGDEGLLPASEDDPFGDEAPRAASPRAAEAAKETAPAGGPPACAGCGKALTKAQQDLSIRNYGEALCPGCQKDKGRAKRPALAER